MGRLAPDWTTRSTQHQRKRCRSRRGARALEWSTLLVPWHRALRLIVFRRCQLGSVYPSVRRPLRYCILFRIQRYTFFIRTSLCLAVMAVTSRKTSRLKQICNQQSFLRNLVGYRLQVISKLAGPEQYKNKFFLLATRCIARISQVGLCWGEDVLSPQSLDAANDDASASKRDVKPSQGFQRIEMEEVEVSMELWPASRATGTPQRRIPSRTSFSSQTPIIESEPCDCFKQTEFAQPPSLPLPKKQAQHRCLLGRFLFFVLHRLNQDWTKGSN